MKTFRNYQVYEHKINNNKKNSKQIFLLIIRLLSSLFPVLLYKRWVLHEMHMSQNGISFTQHSSTNVAYNEFASQRFYDKSKEQLKVFGIFNIILVFFKGKAYLNKFHYDTYRFRIHRKVTAPYFSRQNVTPPGSSFCPPLKIS